MIAYDTLRNDPRFQAMRAALMAQAGSDGRFTPGSMYQDLEGVEIREQKSALPGDHPDLYLCTFRFSALTPP